MNARMIVAAMMTAALAAPLYAAETTPGPGPGYGTMGPGMTGGGMMGYGQGPQWSAPESSSGQTGAAQAPADPSGAKAPTGGAGDRPPPGPGWGPGYGHGYGRGYGPMMGDGRGDYDMGPGMMYGHGYGREGYGMPTYGRGYGPMMGYGRGYGPGYGPGYGMGPGMMYGPGYGMGPGMMYGHGFGPCGMGPHGHEFGEHHHRWHHRDEHRRGEGGPFAWMHMGRVRPQWHDLGVDDVRHYFSRVLERAGNPRLRVGKVEQKGKDSIVATIETVDGSLVDKLSVDRHNGAVTREK